MPVGRKRKTGMHLPPGVREKDGRWYWQPTSARERAERRAKGLACTVPLGPAGTEARKRWAEVAGYADPAPSSPGTVEEILAEFETHGLAKKPNGRPRAAKTVAEYERSITVLRKRFGSCRYGKTEFEASRGQALGVVDLQRFVAEADSPVAANRHLSVMSAAFAHAIRRGLTTYNPCLGVARNAEEPRTRAPLPWEVECLRAVADAAGDALMGLMMDFEGICGWRVSDMRLLQRSAMQADGVHLRQAKRGRRQVWEWTPGLRRIVAEAAALPGANVERLDRAAYVFPTRRGEAITLDAFEKRWAKLKRETNALLAREEIALVIEDLHFHDLRSKAHDDAVDAGEDGAGFLGNDPDVARRVYARREEKMRPLK